MRWLFAAAPVALLGVAADVTAQEVTFARDVAPILQESCQICHREGGMGPMQLLTYEDARRYAARIRTKVASRQMPPWHIDPGIGIQEFKNDVSLSDEEIATVVRWVDSGAPLGNPADMPAPVAWDDSGGWKLEQQFGRPPDLIVKSPPYTVPAQGLDQWYEPVSYIGDLEEERWAMAAEIRPGTERSRYVFHHANSILVGSAAGKDYDVYPSDSGRRLEANQRVDWQMHFFPIGEEVDNAHVEVGVWLYPRGAVPEFEAEFTSFLTDPQANRTVLNKASGCWTQPAQIPLDSPECQVDTRLTDLALAPHSVSTQQGVHVLDRPARLNSIRGHMHMRGKYQTMEAIYPDGRREVLNRINWDHRWHTAHEYADHVAPLLPKGTVLIVTAQYDNTENNPNNPDADQWVFFGRRSADEMGHFHMGITWLEQEDYERLVAERQQASARRVASVNQ
jgi:mono/diheme cytochrome c family protein